MRIGIIGGGVIARLLLQHVARGDMGEARVVAIQGRSAASRGKPLVEQYGVPFVTSLDTLVAERPEMVIEAASHDAVREFARIYSARARIEAEFGTRRVDLTCRSDSTPAGWRVLDSP